MRKAQVNYSEKLRRLADRRQGFYSRAGQYNYLEAAVTGRKAEKFEHISEPPAVKYAIGAMQSVDAAYTAESFAEGNRVRDRLAEGLSNAAIPVAFDYQGSVPLDVHVRGNSDIDLLALHDGFVTADALVKQQYGYVDIVHGTTPVEELRRLRSECAEILKRRYWGATVDESPSKAITLSGGSLKRVVDVVPSHWHDTSDWKSTQDKRHRDIYVYDSKANQRLCNKPFMHIARVAEKCDSVSGALRKVIRLLKNLRFDATPAIELSSYDIAAIAWHMTQAELSVPFYVDLLLVERARLHLSFVVNNEWYSSGLLVPDGSRKIFDVPSKLEAASSLYSELERLASDIVNDLDPLAGVLSKARSQVLSRAIFV